MAARARAARGFHDAVLGGGAVSLTILGQQVDARATGHADVADDDVDRTLRQRRQQLCAVAGFERDLDAIQALEQRRQALQYQCLVVDQGDADSGLRGLRHGRESRRAVRRPL